VLADGGLQKGFKNHTGDENQQKPYIKLLNTACILSQYDLQSKKHQLLHVQDGSISHYSSKNAKQSTVGSINI